MAADIFRTATFKDTESNARILSILNEQRANSRFCDVVLRVCNEQIFAHSNILAAASPYFGSFLGLGQDSPRAFSQKTPQIIEIHIESADGDTGYGQAVRHVVDFMYTCRLELNSLIVTQVTEIARIMQIKRILDYCDRFKRGENGNLPLSKNNSVPCSLTDFSLSRRSLKKTNAATETELSMFQKLAGNNVVPVPGLDDNSQESVTLVNVTLTRENNSNGNLATSKTIDTLKSETVDTTLAIHSSASSAENCVTVEHPVSILDAAPSAFNPINVECILPENRLEVHNNSIAVVKSEAAVLKTEGETLIIPNLLMTGLNETAMDEVKLTESEKSCIETMLADGVAITLPDPDPQSEKLRTMVTKFRKRGRRGRKRKPKEVFSDSEPELIHESDFLHEAACITNEVLEKAENIAIVSDQSVKLEEEVQIVSSHSSSSQDLLQSSKSGTDLLSTTESATECTDSQEKKSTPLPTRTRGRKPITSVMATWSSPRRRAGIPRSLYKSDYVMHSLIRRSRHIGGASLNPLLLAKDEFGEEEDDDMEACDILDKDVIDDGLVSDSTPGLKFVCQTCDFTTASFRLYRQHMKRHPETDTRSYTCTECDFHTTKARQLLQHRKKHLHEELICSFCEVQMDSEENFQIHLQRHSHSLPYFCHSCDMRFKTRTQLATHLPKHMTEKPFVCQVCGNGFKWKHALKNHMVTHSATKDHLCDICGFATAHKSQLKAHHLIHTGNTFKCPEPGCNFEATKRQNLKYHMVTHTQEKAHQCEVCGQAFSLIKNMRRHMLLHGDSRPYHCSNCSYSSTRFDKLKEHKLKQHGIGQPPGKKMKYGSNLQGIVGASGNLAEGTIAIAEDGTLIRTGSDGLHMMEPITIAQDGNNITIRSEVTLTDEALQTIAQLATASSKVMTDGCQEAQETHISIATSEGYPILARVQISSEADMSCASEVVGYVTHME